MHDSQNDGDVSENDNQPREIALEKGPILITAVIVFTNDMPESKHWGKSVYQIKLSSIMFIILEIVEITGIYLVISSAA